MPSIFVYIQGSFIHLQNIENGLSPTALCLVGTYFATSTRRGDSRAGNVNKHLVTPLRDALGQVVLLFLALCVLEDPSCANELRADVALDGRVSEDLQSLITDLAERIDRAIAADIDQFQSLAASSSVEDLHAMHARGLCLDFIALSLQLVGAALSLSSGEEDWGRRVRERLLTETEIVQSCSVGILKGRNPIATGNVLPDASPECVKRNEAVKGALQLLTNLLHGCRKAQVRRPNLT